MYHLQTVMCTIMVMTLQLLKTSYLWPPTQGSNKPNWTASFSSYYSVDNRRKNVALDHTVTLLILSICLYIKEANVISIQVHSYVCNVSTNCSETNNMKTEFKGDVTSRGNTTRLLRSSLAKLIFLNSVIRNYSAHAEYL